MDFGFVTSTPKATGIFLCSFIWYYMRTKELVRYFGIFLYLLSWIYLLPFHKNTNKIHF